MVNSQLIGALRRAVESRTVNRYELQGKLVAPVYGETTRSDLQPLSQSLSVDKDYHYSNLKQKQKSRFKVL